MVTTAQTDPRRGTAGEGQVEGIIFGIFAEDFRWLPAADSSNEDRVILLYRDLGNALA